MKRETLLPHVVRKLFCLTLSLVPVTLSAQGVTTAALTGFVTSQDGAVIEAANVVAVHLPSGTQYRATVTSSGRYNLPNMRIGGPYRVTATSIGYEPHSEPDVFLSLGQTSRLDFRLIRQAVQLAGVQVAL